MSYITIRRLMFILTIAVIGVGCNDTSTGVGDDQDPATVEGRVDDGSSDSESAKLKGVEGAVVTAARVNSEGELQTINGAETQTNGQGEFTLEIEADAVADASDRIVIIAEQSGESTKAYVTSEVTSGATVQVQPITVESSAETHVYQELIASGEADVVTKADIEVAVNATVAADIQSNTGYAADVAAALAAYAEAKSEFYAEQGIELTEEQKEEIRQAKIDAQVKLESQLNAAANTEEEKAAFETFVQALAKAELDAGVNSTAVAKASESSFHVLINESADLSSEAQAEIRQQFAYMLTFAMEQAVQAQLEAAGAAEATINAVADAAANLRTEIKAMSDASASAVSSAYADFNSEVEALVSQDANLEGELFASVNTTINEEGGAKATLESSLESVLNISPLLDAYTEFYADVRSAAETAFESTGDAEVEAYTQLLILINITS